MKKKIEMTRQEYRKSLERFGEIKTPEEARAFHKEMRCYKNAPRVPLFRRYPEIPDKVSIDKWCLCNTAVDVDKNDNIQPIKTSKPRRRIDGTAALLDAYVVLQNNINEYMSLI